MKKIRTGRSSGRRQTENDRTVQAQASSPDQLCMNIQENLQRLKDTLGNSDDLMIREFEIGSEPSVAVAIVYIEGLVDIQMVSQYSIKSMMSNLPNENQPLRNEDVPSLLKDRILAYGSVKDVTERKQMFLDLFSGHVLVFIDKQPLALSANSHGLKDRGVEEPSSQTVIRGPKEGFTESLRTNTALLRRKIKSPNLRLETRTIGSVTQTSVAIMYIKDIADEKVVEEVRKRLANIEIDSVLESGYIEEFIQDETFTPFPTVYNSERTDTIAAGLLEGQVAILVDGTPFVLLVPVTLFKFFQSSEDYYQRYDISTFLRLLRIFAFVVSLLLPSLYIAITTFHQEMLPTTLLISLAAQREGVPFPAFVEAFVMELIFEVLREAGVRMPRAVGQAVSVVGALVLGQAAVQAGLVSAAMVIIVAFTAISNFVTPAFNLAIAARMLRFYLMILAATLGLFGIVAGVILLLLHMGGLRSFGVPYLAPIAPFYKENQKDIFLRAPWWAMVMRPRLISKNNKRRQKRKQEPSPPSKKE